MEDVFELTYDEILKIKDLNKKRELLEQFKIEVEKVKDEYGDFDYRYSIIRNIYKLQELSFNCSEYLFPGCNVIYYPIVKELLAKKDYTCSYSSALIKSGSLYIQYKAFLYNLSDKSAFVSKIIRLEVGTDFVIPNTLMEFEDLYYKINHSYEMNLDDYYNINANIGGMSLRRLKRRK